MPKKVNLAQAGIILVCLVLTVFSNVSAAEVLPAPELISPRKNLATTDSTPTFVWSHVPESVKYTLEIKDRVTNAVIAKTTYAASVRCSGGICSVPSPVSLTDGDYKWHVLSRRNDVKGTWSKWWNLTIGKIPLDTPVQVAPAYGQTVYQSQPILVWTPIDGALDYRIQVKDPDGNYIVTSTQTNAICRGTDSGNCEYQFPFDFPDYGTYRWHVQAKNGQSYSSWASYSPMNYVKVPRTTLISPFDHTTVYNSRPTFTWTHVKGATHYQLQIKRLGSVAQNILVPASSHCAGSSCTYSLVDSLGLGVHEWHVRGRNDANYGRWTAYWEFEISK